MLQNLSQVTSHNEWQQQHNTTSLSQMMSHKIWSLRQLISLSAEVGFERRGISFEVSQVMSSKVWSLSRVKSHIFSFLTCVASHKLWRRSDDESHASGSKLSVESHASKFESNDESQALKSDYFKINKLDMNVRLDWPPQLHVSGSARFCTVLICKFLYNPPLFAKTESTLHGISH